VEKLKLEDLSSKIEQHKESISTCLNNISNLTEKLTTTKEEIVTSIDKKYADHARVNQLNGVLIQLSGKIETNVSNISEIMGKLDEIQTPPPSQDPINNEKLSTILNDIEILKKLPAEIEALKRLPDEFESLKRLPAEIEPLKRLPAEIEILKKLPAEINEQIESLRDLPEKIQETRDAIDKYATALEYEKLPKFKNEIIQDFDKFLPTSNHFQNFTTNLGKLIENLNKQVTVLQFCSYDKLKANSKISLQTGVTSYKFNFNADIIGVTFYHSEQVHASMLLNPGGPSLILARSDLRTGYKTQELNFNITKGNTLEFHSHVDFTPEEKQPSFYVEIYLRTIPKLI